MLPRYLFSLCAIACAARADISPPLLGFVFNDELSAVQPLVGIPGAALVSAPLNVSLAIRTVEFSPLQNYALVIGEDDRVHILRFDDPYKIQTLNDNPAPGRMAISPSGKSAALLIASQKQIDVITGLPDKPSVAGHFGIPADCGEVVSFAVDDAGETILLGSSNCSGAMVFSTRSEAVGHIELAGNLKEASFQPRSSTAAILTDTAEIWLVANVAGAMRSDLLKKDVGLGEGDRSLAFSRDGLRLFYADSVANGTWMFNVVQQEGTLISCGCSPYGIVPLNGNAVFRILETASHRVLVLDAGTDANTSQPRLLVVPPDAL